MAELSVLIVNYNSWRECATAIATLREHGPKQRDGSPLPFECIVVDNLSPQRDPAQIAAVEHELALLCEQQRDPRGAARHALRERRLQQEHERRVQAQPPAAGSSSTTRTCSCRASSNVPAAPSNAIRRPAASCRRVSGIPAQRAAAEHAAYVVDILFTTWGDIERRQPLACAASRASVARRVDGRQPIALPMMSGCVFPDRRSFWVVGLFDERFPLYYETPICRSDPPREGNAWCGYDAFLVHFVNRSGMTDQSMWKRHHTSRRLYYEVVWAARAFALRASRWLLGVKSLALALRVRDAARGSRRARDHPCSSSGGSATVPRAVVARRGSTSRRVCSAAAALDAGPAAFDLFVAATYYFAAYDLTGGRFQRIGTWRYACLSHLGVPVPSTAPAKPQVVSSTEAT
jgi:hypothetical protein